MEKFWQDIRHGIRMLWKNPAFTLIAITTLALGIGANAAIFSVVSSVMLRPYPYKESDQLTVLRMVNLKRDIADVGLSYADFTSLKERNTVFQDMALFTTRRFNLSGMGDGVQVKGAATTANLFSLIGGQAALGRTFSSDEDRPGSGNVVVLSQGLWQRNFGADEKIIGKQVRLDGDSYMVIGVVSPAAQFPDTQEAELFVPLALDPAQAPRSRSFFSLARLKNGTSGQRAQIELSAIATQMAQERPDINEGWGVQLSSLRDYRTKDAHTPLMILFGAVGLVLLIACVNVANLLLQRGAGRQREMAVRAALGASPSRLIQQLLTESLLISLLASCVGLFLSHWFLKLIVKLIPAAELPGYLRNFQIDTRILLYLLIISVVTAVLFGLVPALRIVKTNLTETLKDAGRNPTAGPGHHRIRNLLIVSEVSLSLMLLIAAGLMVQSFQRMQRVDLGFNLEQTMAAEFSLSAARYKETTTRTAFYQKLFERIQALPGIKNVGAATRLPIGDWLKSTFFVEGQSPEEQKASPLVDIQSIGGDYFQTAGMKIVKGRAFNAHDGTTAPPVIIINENVARRFWPNQDPIGKRVKLALAQDTWLTVAGLVNNTKRAVFNRSSSLEVYTPYDQRTRGDMILFVRTDSDPLGLASAVRGELAALDQDLAVQFRTIQQATQDSLWAQKLLGSLFGLFAIIAIVLAAIGIYGTISCSVSQRTHEIGIRMALGARQMNVLKLILKQGTVLAVIGIILGLGGAFTLNRVLSSLLFGVSSSDPFTFIIAALLLGTISLIATLIPAYNASKVEPAIALRHS